MWVHYGDMGIGVTLIFNENFFEDKDLYQVQYIDTKNIDNAEEQPTQLVEKIQEIFDFLSTNQVLLETKNETFIEWINIIINYVSYFFKDKAYEYEQEIRMISFRDYESEDIKIDETREVPRLYIEHPQGINKENCVEVVVGPKVNFEEVSAYVKYIGIKSVTRSNIKYR